MVLTFSLCWDYVTHATAVTHGFSWCHTATDTRVGWCAVISQETVALIEVRRDALVNRCARTCASNRDVLTSALYSLQYRPIRFVLQVAWLRTKRPRHLCPPLAMVCPLIFSLRFQHRHRVFAACASPKLYVYQDNNGLVPDSSEFDFWNTLNLFKTYTQF